MIDPSASLALFKFAHRFRPLEVFDDSLNFRYNLPLVSLFPISGSTKRIVPSVQERT
jgi:hypothetical protein